MNTLEKYEDILKMVKYSHCMRNVRYFQCTEMANEYERLTGTQVNRNWTCTNCMFKFLEMVANYYFDNKTTTTTSTTTEAPTTTTSTTTEAPKITKEQKNKKNVKG